MIIKVIFQVGKTANELKCKADIGAYKSYMGREWSNGIFAPMLIIAFS